MSALPAQGNVDCSGEQGGQGEQKPILFLHAHARASNTAPARPQKAHVRVCVMSEYAPLASPAPPKTGKGWQIVSVINEGAASSIGGSR